MGSFSCSRPVIPKKKRLYNVRVYICIQIGAIFHYEIFLDQSMRFQATQTTSLANTPLYMIPQGTPDYKSMLQYK